MPAFLAWPVIKAFFSGALSKLWTWLCHRSFWQLMFGAALILAGWEYIGKRAEQRHAHKVETQLSKCTAGRKADRDAYAKAQTDAAAKNVQQVQRIEQQQQKVTDDVEAHYRADLARLRAERGKLQPANAAPQRPTGQPGSSTPGPASGGAGGQAMPLPAAELLRAQETELQLNALIDWVLQQSAIDPNKP